jgi:phosphoglycolate phosphatase
MFCTLRSARDIRAAVAHRGRHLFFDLDGTLTEPALGITACIEHALRALGVPPPAPAELRRFIGPPLRDAFAELLRTSDAALIEDAVRLYRERFSSVGLFENEPYPGIGRVLTELDGDGFGLVVVTSKPEVYARRILRHFELARFFANVYGAELSGERSTKAELVAHALQRESLGPERVCMIGDRRHDIEGARACGVRAIGVAWGHGSVDELRAAGADVVVATLPELPGACRARWV